MNERKHTEIKNNSTVYGFNVEMSKNVDRAKILRNMVDPELGLHILECARGNYNYLKQNQENIFK